MADSKVRGWIYIIVAILAGWFTYSGNIPWAIYLLALSMLFSGWHHISKK